MLIRELEQIALSKGGLQSVLATQTPDNLRQMKAFHKYNFMRLISDLGLAHTNPIVGQSVVIQEQTLPLIFHFISPFQ